MGEENGGFFLMTTVGTELKLKSLSDNGVFLRGLSMAALVILEGTTNGSSCLLLFFNAAFDITFCFGLFEVFGSTTLCLGDTEEQDNTFLGFVWLTIS